MTPEWEATTKTVIIAKTVMPPRHIDHVFGTHAPAITECHKLSRLYQHSPDDPLLGIVLPSNYVDGTFMVRRVSFISRQNPHQSRAGVYTSIIIPIEIITRFSKTFRPGQNIQSRIQTSSNSGPATLMDTPIETCYWQVFHEFGLFIVRTVSTCNTPPDSQITQGMKQNILAEHYTMIAPGLRQFFSFSSPDNILIPKEEVIL